MATKKKTGAARRQVKETNSRAAITVSEPMARRTIESHGFRREDAAILATARDIVAPALVALLDDFYMKVQSEPETAALLAKHSSVSAQRPILERYVLTLFDDVIDDKWLGWRKKVGAIHARIDLPASYFIVMYTVLEEHLRRAAVNARWRGERLASYETALVRMLRVDMALVLTAFDDARRERIALVEGSRLRPIDRVMAVAEFAPDGTLLEANDNFLRTVGYTLDELKGRHHRTFVDAVTGASSSYADLWAKLNRGDCHASESRYVGKNGTEIWVQTSYNPVFDRTGKVVRIAEFATDITKEKIRVADYEAQIRAIHKATAVAEFAPDGTVLGGNDLFCTLIGYAADELKGRHHSLFLEPEESKSANYAEFWRQLGEGRSQSGDYRRIGKGGRVVWMRASYNPIYDLNGKLTKVVKLATDITEGKLAAEKQAEMSRTIAENAAAADAFIGEAGSVLERLSARDMTARMVGEYTGDYDRLKGVLNLAVDNLDTALDQVASASNEVSTACREITGASQSLAQATSRSAATIEDVTSRLHEMGSIASQNARNSQEARTLADAARLSADKGSESMQRLSQSIEKIKASSDETAKIVKTIDDIAFQTNLLALNAAVEAARAGDAGRGFAVVAEEVRNLAMRSAESARMTAQMIAGSVKNAEEGVQYNREVLENLNEITSRVRRVGEVMQEIAVASETQNETVTQINESTEELAKLTQQNAATSEETASAAEELTGQANGLIEMVGEFELSGQPVAPPPRVQPRAASRVRPPSMRPAPPQRTTHARPAQPPTEPQRRARPATPEPQKRPLKTNGTIRRQSADAVFPLDDDVLGKF